MYVHAGVMAKSSYTGSVEQCIPAVWIQIDRIRIFTHSKIILPRYWSRKQWPSQLFCTKKYVANQYNCYFSQKNRDVEQLPRHASPLLVSSRLRKHGNGNFPSQWVVSQAAWKWKRFAIFLLKFNKKLALPTPQIAILASCHWSKTIQIQNFVFNLKVVRQTT